MTGTAAVNPGLQRSSRPADGQPMTDPPAAALDTPSGVYGRYAELAAAALS